MIQRVTIAAIVAIAGILLSVLLQKRLDRVGKK